MKLYKTYLMIFIIMMIVSVKADSSAFLEVNCNDNKISSDKELVCKLNLLHENIYIDKMEMDYSTNLDISFEKLSGFTYSNENNKLIIQSNETLFGEIMDSSIISKFNLKIKDNLHDEAEVSFSNIKLFNNKDLNNPVLLNDVKKTILITSSNELDSNNTLESIFIDGNKLSNFDKNTLEYKNIIVHKPVVFIDATRSSERSMATGLGNVLIKDGETIVRKIKVTAENGEERIYSLSITHEIVKEKNTDNTLQSLELYNGDAIINLNFDKNKTIYNIKLEEDLEGLTVKAITNNELASFVPKYGPRNIKLDYGNNKIEIKVQAENGNIKIYTLNINRPDNRSNDISLFMLKINDEMINLGDTVTDYEIEVSDDIEETKIEAMANSDKATVTYQDKKLQEGDNEVTVLVTAENGSKKEYKINVIRLPEEITKKIFEGIKISGYEIDFSKEKHEYTITIGKDVWELDIVILPEDINHEILNNTNLINGSKITINIHDDEGDSVYTILVNKETDKDYSLICYGVFAIGVILLSLSIIVTIKRNKK